MSATPCARDGYVENEKELGLTLKQRHQKTSPHCLANSQRYPSLLLEHRWGNIQSGLSSAPIPGFHGSSQVISKHSQSLRDLGKNQKTYGKASKSMLIPQRPVSGGNPTKFLPPGP
jgi:hypothetical protein